MFSANDFATEPRHLLKMIFFGCLVNDRLLKLELFEGHSVKLIYENFQVFPLDGILSNLQKYANVISILSIVD